FNMTTKLVLQIVRHARECVAPLRAQLVGDIFIASGKRNRLKRDRLHLVDVLRGKLDDLTDTIVVDTVNDRHDEGDFDSSFCEVLDRSQLNVEQVANTAVLILLFTHAVKLKIHTMLSRSLCGFAELEIFSEANSVRRGEYAIETDLLRVSDCVEIIRRERRLTAGEEDNDLPSRLE